MAKYDEFEIDQGADFAMEIHLEEQDGTVKDLSNYFVEAKVKRTYNSDSDNTFNFNAIIAEPETDGIITLELNNQQTDTMKKGRYVFDVEISFIDSDNNTIIERVLEGVMNVKPSATR
jgi:hypothetical protein